MERKTCLGIALGVLAVGCMALPVAALSQPTQPAAALPAVQTATELAAPAQAATITVEGVGRLAHTPDMAVLTVECRTEADSAAAALTGNSARVEAVVRASLAAGVEQEDILPVSYQMGAAKQGYQVTTELRITIPKVEQCGIVADAAVAAGAHADYKMDFVLADDKAIRAQLANSALEDAKARAEALAGAAGKRPGEVCGVQMLACSESELRIQVIYEMI